MRRLMFLALAVAAACAPPQPTGPTYESNIAPLLNARCVNCHTTGGIAPFSLLSYADAKPMAAAMVAAVEKGEMPPWKAAPTDVEYLRNPHLSDEQVALLRDWATNGAPEGDPAAKKDELAPITGGIENVDLLLKMPEPYTPKSGTGDDYRCFVLPWPKTETMFVTGFNALPNVPKEVHHIAVYLVPPDAAATVQKWDDDEAGPGYTCFGGPFGQHPQAFAVNLLTAWIPGYAGVKYPRGMGIEVPPGSTLVLQLHYNTEQGVAPDQSEIQFSLSKTAQVKAAYQPFLDIAWVGGGMRIPAGEKDVMFQHVADPRDFFKLLGSPLDNTRGFNIEAVMFHMHRRGAKGEVWLEKANQTRVKLLDIPAYDFHWQLEYYLTQPVKFEPGDQLRVRCTFDNSQERQPAGDTIPHDVNWGENSNDEMCVANMLSSQLP